ncbi:uncharacterized protein LOC101448592 [Ceratitis capitata]|uniref:(Mediterranean fruit fly) hypothetical protein n=3 Tax=Ceratitis capitata TaxID=7213 RepID=A0A811VER5_CERCA|nr:uncharacterized protein LOC101448592 [Ceratitis capitata]CAD7012672.1 unnamed protein product [Ceratitis capitata]
MQSLKLIALTPAAKILTATKASQVACQRLTSNVSPSNALVNSDMVNPGGRPNCLLLEPRCGIEKMRNVTCKPREFPPDFNFDECCPPCRDVLPRFDDLYYKPSDKDTRKYQQTWSECPRLLITPRLICCTEETDVPLLEKRVFKRRDEDMFELYAARLCRNTKEGRCAKLSWPGCRMGRVPPKCFVIKPMSDCKKRCTPYPSYSECLRDPARQLRPVECNCLKVGPLCLN